MKRYEYEINLAEGNHAATKILQLVGRNKKVLEVGCASGTQTRIMKEQLDCAVTGVEINGRAAEEARPYCEQLIIGDIENLDLYAALNGAKFDAVLFADVLEHLFDPGMVLRKVLPVLADDGCVIASIPNIAHSSVILGLAYGKFQYRDFGLLDNTHIRFFTKESVFSTFESAGFRIESLDRVIHVDCDTESHPIHVMQTENPMLDFLHQNNPESDTFQFIVKARKAVATTGPTEGLQPNPEERIAALERKLADKTEDLRQLDERIIGLEKQLAERAEGVRRLESQLTWITSRPAYRFLSRVRNLLRPLKR